MYLSYEEFRRELDFFLEEYSISELLELVYYAVQCREDELKRMNDQNGNNE